MTPSIHPAENDRTSPSADQTQSPTDAPFTKLRSCVVCRSRKVRCDKKIPCSNCRRGNIACVLPTNDRSPRWARRLERVDSHITTLNKSTPNEVLWKQGNFKNVADRLRSIETLVQELRDELEFAQHNDGVVTRDISRSDNLHAVLHDKVTECQPDQLLAATEHGEVHQHFGRMVLDDGSRTRYVSSGFWSRIDDELDGLDLHARKASGDESDSSVDETANAKTAASPVQERTRSESHAFLLQSALKGAGRDLDAFRPLPSQRPFLLEVFSRNVNYFFKVVHMPTVTKMLHGVGHGNTKPLTLSHEALLFSIYYAAIVSMEENDVITSFAMAKSELGLKFRIGLEQALASANFLDTPDLILVQAFAIFVFLVRRHDSPSFVWMMTGLLIRMAQYLGLHRDGSHFQHLRPYEIEMRRRVWWSVCMLDLRASEDQGTDLTIISGAFDTKIPLNINERDIDPETEKMPTEHPGVTDMSFSRISAGMTDIMRKMMALSLRKGMTSIDDQSQLLSEIHQICNHQYFRHETEVGNITYWVAKTIMRLVMAKMTLIVFLPVLFSSPDASVSEEIRHKLLISAIEVAEYNHELNAEPACRHWRWIYQTHTHWHSIVYLVLEATRRSWSSVIERAWQALHSKWLIPVRARENKTLRIWIPLWKMMSKAHQHREAELSRLRADPHAVAELEQEAQKFPSPSSSGSAPSDSTGEIWRRRWRQLVSLPAPGQESYKLPAVSMREPSPSTVETRTETQLPTADTLMYNFADPMPDNPNPWRRPIINENHESLCQRRTQFQDYPALASDDPKHDRISDDAGDFKAEKNDGIPYGTFSLRVDYEGKSDGRSMGPGPIPWLWADAELTTGTPSVLDTNLSDVDMNLGGEFSWYDWVESAKCQA